MMNETLIQKVLRNIFYSRLFNKVRRTHYRDAYNQGRFDEALRNHLEVGE